MKNTKSTEMEKAEKYFLDFWIKTKVKDDFDRLRKDSETMDKKEKIEELLNLIKRALRYTKIGKVNLKGAELAISEKIEKLLEEMVSFIERLDNKKVNFQIILDMMNYIIDFDRAALKNKSTINEDNEDEFADEREVVSKLLISVGTIDKFNESKKKYNKLRNDYKIKILNLWLEQIDEFLKSTLAIAMRDDDENGSSRKVLVDYIVYLKAKMDRKRKELNEKGESAVLETFKFIDKFFNEQMK